MTIFEIVILKSTIWIGLKLWILMAVSWHDDADFLFSFNEPMDIIGLYIVSLEMKEWTVT